MAEAVANLRVLAEQVYLEHEYTLEGINALETMIKEDAAMLTLAVRRAAKEALRDAQRQARHVIEGSSQGAPEGAQGGPPKVYDRAFQESVVVAVGKFYQWPLPGGPRLELATKGEVLEAAALYHRQADGNARKAKFLELVAARLRNGQRVGQVLSEKQLERMMDKAGKPAANAAAG